MAAHHFSRYLTGQVCVKGDNYTYLQYQCGAKPKKTTNIALLTQQGSFTLQVLIYQALYQLQNKLNIFDQAKSCNANFNWRIVFFCEVEKFNDSCQHKNGECFLSHLLKERVDFKTNR